MLGVFRGLQWAIFTLGKHWIPLECNPDLFTQATYRLDIFSHVVFQDVLLLDSEVLSLVPRPVLALRLVFLTSKIYETDKVAEESMKQNYKGFGEGEDYIGPSR